MNDIIQILLIIVGFILIITIILYLYYALQPQHHYRFYIPHTQPPHHIQEEFTDIPSFYKPFNQTKCSKSSKDYDYGGCRMGTIPYITDYSKKHLPENKGLPDRPENCLDFFPQKQQDLIKKICPKIKIKPIPSNNRGNVWCCPNSIEDLIAIKHRTKSLGGCGYNSTPANLTYKKYGLCLRIAQNCAPGWKTSKNPNGTIEYSSDTGQKCCVVQEGKELDVISNIANICNDIQN